MRQVEKLESDTSLMKFWPWQTLQGQARDEPRKQVQLTIWAPNGRRIQDALGFERAARFRLHQQPEPLQQKATH